MENINFDEFRKTMVEKKNNNLRKNIPKIQKQYKTFIDKINSLSIELNRDLRGLEQRLPEGYVLTEDYQTKLRKIVVTEVEKLSVDENNLLINGMEAHSLGDHKTAKAFIKQLRDKMEVK